MTDIDYREFKWFLVMLTVFILFTVWAFGLAQGWWG